MPLKHPSISMEVLEVTTTMQVVSEPKELLRALPSYQVQLWWLSPLKLSRLARLESSFILLILSGVFGVP
jgi:hypothetical protein